MRLETVLATVMGRGGLAYGAAVAPGGPRRSISVAWMMLLVLVVRAQGQSPADRTMLTAWTDSIDQAVNAGAITRYDGPSRHGSGRAGELRRALFQVRHADLTGDRGEIELVLTNMQVMANRTSWAWPCYVMALGFEVMARKGWVEALSDGKQPGEKHSDATWRTLRLALDRDPGLAPARRTLGRLTAAGGDRFLRPDQVRALERESRQPAPDPDALLAWGRHLRTLEEYDAALRTFARAVARGGDRSRLALERARTLQATGDAAAAAAAYWDGVTHLTATGRDAYRVDLLWIADPQEVTSFDGAPNDGVPEWLRRFWNARDAEAASVPGDRLEEHLRRWVVAFGRYRALAPWKDAFWSRVEPRYDNAPCEHTDARMFELLWHLQPSYRGDLRGHEPLLDNRGVVYLRHGEPTRTVTSRDADVVLQPWRIGSTGPMRNAAGPGGAHLSWSAHALGEIPDVTTGPSTETWLYWFGGEWRAVTFRGSDALGRYAATTLTQMVPPTILFDPALASSVPIREYVALARRMADNAGSIWGGAASATQIARRDPPGCMNEVRAVVARTARDERASLEHDSDTPLGELPWPNVVQAFALGNPDEHSGIGLVTFAIAGDGLVPEPAGVGRVRYALGYRIVAYNPATDRTVVIDTTRQFVTNHQLRRGEFLTAWAELPLSSGTWRVSARMWEDEGTIRGYALNRDVTIDGGAGTTLSDIVTGRPGTPDWIATDSLPFPINYPNGWYQGETAELFYEVRGVPSGAAYQTAIDVRPMDPEAPGLTRILSTDRGTGGVTHVRKTLGLAQLAPGRYRLVVSVKYGGTRSAREREILIVARP